MKPPKRASAHPDDTTIPNVPVVGEPWNFSRVETVLRLPASIAYNAQLSYAARLLWGIIRSLSWRDGRCFAKNETLCERLGCQERHLRNLCAELKQFGFLRETRRQNASPVRELLWNAVFNGDAPGGENPGPDEGEDEPNDFILRDTVARQFPAEPTAKSCRPNGNPVPLHRNLMRGDVLEETSSVIEPPPVENPSARRDDDSRINALANLGINRPGAAAAIKGLPADFPFDDALEYYVLLVRASEGKIKRPAGFICDMLATGTRPPAHFESSAKREARLAREAEERAQQAAAILREEAQLEALIESWRANDPGRYSALEAAARLYSSPASVDWRYDLLDCAREMLAAEGNRPQCIGEAQQERQQPGEVSDAPNFRQL